MATVSAAAYHAGKFLQEHELLPACQTCPWCQFAGRRAPVLPLQKSPDVWLLKCPACYAISASRVATQAAIDTYYASYYSDTVKRVTCGNPSHHARHICRYTRLPRSLTKITVLDFGGGDGSISHALAVELVKQRGNLQVDIVVVDYNQSLVAPADSLVSMSHASTIQEIPAGNRFDLILASAILEHLPEPAEITRKLLHALAPGGYFYARTPYMVPLLRIFERMHVAYDFTFPAHFHDLGQDFWDRILPTLSVTSGEWTLERSRPSLVETSFSDNFGRTVLSHGMKAPWWILRRSYPLVGGWEVFVHRKLAP